VIKEKIIIVNYGLGNILSLERSIKNLNYEVCTTSNTHVIANASKVILPGVGSYGFAVSKLKELGIFEALNICKEKNTPILGICLGMQLLFDTSLEFGVNHGLGFIEGKIIPIRQETKKQIKIPNINWLKISKNKINNNQVLLNNLSIEDRFYFIHSYFVKVKFKESVVAYSKYYDVEIPAIVNKKNIYGCQFHPEKSANSGLKILKNFLELNV
tara:strand:+ start:1684 stop:2325 length:642 start_codon:yes stop_codon:yes gene_type:complete